MGGNQEVTGAQMEPSKKPLNVLVKQLNAKIAILLKNGYEYKGKMVKCDGHMNILLEGASEYRNGRLIKNYGDILLRGNNVLWIKLDMTK